jgi:hypothetical protein
VLLQCVLSTKTVSADNIKTTTKKRQTETSLLRESSPRIPTTHGMHEGLKLGKTEVIYYIPKNFDPENAEYLFGIHGAGDWHRPGAINRIHQFRKIADAKNLVIIAPAFDCIFKRSLNRKKDFDEKGKLKDKTIIKDWYLWDFARLLNKRNQYRSDLKLIQIFNFFNKYLMKREKFHLYGHSGGGQFVVRFIIFHPKLVSKVAASSAGSYVFPDYNIDYSYGLRMDNLKKIFGRQIKTQGIKLSVHALERRVDQMLDLKLFIIAGENDTKIDNRPDRSWQGKHRLERAQNFYKAMKTEDQRLKQKGIRSKSKPFQFEVHVMPGKGHDSAAAAQKAIELLFPIQP